MEILILILIAAAIRLILLGFSHWQSNRSRQALIDQLKQNSAIAKYAELHPDCFDFETANLDRETKRLTAKACEFIARSSYEIPISQHDEKLVEHAFCYASSKSLGFEEIGISGIKEGTYMADGNIVGQVYKGKLFVNPKFTSYFASAA